MDGVCYRCQGLTGTKKQTINKFRKLDAQANEEAQRELEYRIKEHLYLRDPIEFRNWTSACAYATGDKDNDLRILKKLNVLAEEIGADTCFLLITTDFP